MTMSPQTFHDLLEGAVSQPPPPPGVGRDLAEGRRLLRRRRVISAVGTAAAVAVLASGTALALQVDLRPETPQGPVDRSSSDADLLESCRNGYQGDWATDVIFAAQPPRVISVVRTAHQAVLAIESAEGRYWAECEVPFNKGESPGMQVYDGRMRTKDKGYMHASAGCRLAAALDGTCPALTVWLVDRLPEMVAAVRFDLGDGTSQTRATEEGYVVLNVVIDPRATIQKRFRPIRQVTYLDESGTALAAMRWDGLGRGPKKRVEGLPPLSDYPSLRQ